MPTRRDLPRGQDGRYPLEHGEDILGLLRRHQYPVDRGRARAARRSYARNGAAADALHRGDHFEHGCSFAYTKVEGAALAPLIEILQGTDMRGSKIRDVYVITDGRTIRSGIVGSKYPQAITLF